MKTTIHRRDRAATCVDSIGAGRGYVRPPPLSQQPYTVNQPLANSWIGPYIGGNLGYGWGDVSNSGAKPSGVLGGVQVGYNWQNGAWVAGIEGDLQLNAADDTFAPWKFSNPWFGTVRGRAGYAFNNVLLYGTGGFAFGSLRSERGGGISESTTSAAGPSAPARNSRSTRTGRPRSNICMSISAIRTTTCSPGLPNGYAVQHVFVSA
jgi:outer membrane immunogenic protein